MHLIIDIVKSHTVHDYHRHRPPVNVQVHQ